MTDNTEPPWSGSWLVDIKHVPKRVTNHNYALDVTVWVANGRLSGHTGAKTAHQTIPLTGTLNCELHITFAVKQIAPQHMYDCTTTNKQAIKFWSTFALLYIKNASPKFNIVVISYNLGLLVLYVSIKHVPCLSCSMIWDRQTYTMQKISFFYCFYFV